MKFSGKVWSDHGTTWLHFRSVRRNYAMPRYATRGRLFISVMGHYKLHIMIWYDMIRGLLCFRTTACCWLQCVCRVACQRHRLANVHIVVRPNGHRSVDRRIVQFFATEEDILLPLGWRNIRYLRWVFSRSLAFDFLFVKVGYYLMITLLQISCCVR